VVPLKVQESDKAAEPDQPPNNTNLPNAASYTIDADERADGDTDGDSCVHVDPFHAHVSFN